VGLVTRSTLLAILAGTGIGLALDLALSQIETNLRSAVLGTRGNTARQVSWTSIKRGAQEEHTSINQL
jgi:hypothetical protein